MEVVWMKYIVLIFLALAFLCLGMSVNPEAHYPLISCSGLFVTPQAAWAILCSEAIAEAIVSILGLFGVILQDQKNAGINRRTRHESSFMLKYSNETIFIPNIRRNSSNILIC